MILGPETGSVAVFGALGLFAAAAAISLVGPRAGRAALLLSAAGGIVLVAVGAIAASDGPIGANLGGVLGLLPFELRYDALSAPFVALLGLVGAAASLYAFGHDAARSRLDGVAYPAFLASLGLVFGADSALAFIGSWEAMALASAALVVGPRPAASTARVGYIYVALTHVATAAIVAAFALLGSAAGSFDFGAMRSAAPAIDPVERDAIFVLLVLGFATKGGLVPLHVWLPRAHPEAPSHVSALMSGVMVKAGVFGILRVVVDLLGPGPVWWGVGLIALGAVSAVLGALYALVEQDLKRLLAFSTIENVGIVFIGLGVGLVGASVGSIALTVLGLAAAIVHTVNHGAFKGLLFLVAGAIQTSAGTRDLDRLGGLSRVMPWTSLLFVVGALALAAVPPSSGFAGEWLTFQGLLAAGAAAGVDPVVRFACLLAVAAVALAAGLALGAIVKAVGTALLALPRSPGAGEAVDAGRVELAAGGILAVATVGLGLFADPVRRLAAGIAASPGSSPSISGTGPATLGHYEPLAIAGVISALIVAIWAAARWRAAETRRAPTWACGIEPLAAHEYTATSFDKPARLFFEPILRPIRSREVELHPGTPFPHRVTYRSEVEHVVESRVYVPLHRAFIRFAQVARRLQHGTLQLYVAYTVAALVVLLVAARR